MNEKKLETKVRQDAAKVKKNFDMLVKDATVRMGKFEDQTTQTTGKAKEELTARMEENLSQLSKDFEKLMHEASVMRKDVGHGLSKVNTKAQKMIHKKSDDAARKTAIISWVSFSLAVAVGFVAFILLRPVQKSAV